MFLRSTRRRRDGKEQRYFSVVENVRRPGRASPDQKTLLYDLTSPYFEGAAEHIPKAEYGYSRDHRLDGKQVVIALVITPEGCPLAYECGWAAKAKAGRAQRFVTLSLPAEDQTPARDTFSFRLDRAKLKKAQLYDGH